MLLQQSYEKLAHLVPTKQNKSNDYICRHDSNG